VVAVGNVEAAALEAGAAPLVSHENEAWLRVQVPELLVLTEVLLALGATDTVAGARFWLEPPQGPPFALDVGARAPLPVLVNLTTSGVPLPLHEQRQDENYWSTTLEGSRAVYLQYNRCRQGVRALRDVRGAHLPASRPGSRRPAGGRPPPQRRRRLQRGRPADRRAQGRPAWRARGRLFCLTGSGTFSSAVWTAVDLQRLGAVLVGGPTGGKPNGCGNVQTLVLPNSRLPVSYSTRFFRLIEGSDPASLVPELPVEPTIDDLRLGRDPLLEAALRFTN
jgi:hypothetical protein